MDDTEVKRIREEIWRLALAAQDMRLVASAAQELLDAHAPSLVLEAGLVAVYCRSFSQAPSEEGERPRKHVVDELAPDDSLHDRLWRFRNKGVGHTDADYEHRREAVDVFGNHRHQVEYSHLNRDLLAPIEYLAMALATRFKEAQEERERKLRDAGVEPEPYFGTWGDPGGIP